MLLFLCTCFLFSLISRNVLIFFSKFLSWPNDCLGLYYLICMHLYKFQGSSNIFLVLLNWGHKTYSIWFQLLKTWQALICALTQFYPEDCSVSFRGLLLVLLSRMGPREEEERRNQLVQGCHAHNTQFMCRTKHKSTESPLQLEVGSTEWGKRVEPIKNNTFPHWVCTNPEGIRIPKVTWKCWKC